MVKLINQVAILQNGMNKEFSTLSLKIVLVDEANIRLKKKKSSFEQNCKDH